MPSRDDRLTRLYEKYNRHVRAYCLRRLGDDEASDAVAGVFAVAWRRIDDIPADDALLWLYGVSRRVVSDHYRSRNRRSRLRAKLAGVRSASPSQPETQVVQREEYRNVQLALESLRAPDREVLLLAAWEELSNDQIARVVGCSVPAAAQRVHRAKQRLGRAYRTLSADGPPVAGIEGGSNHDR